MSWMQFSGGMRLNPPAAGSPEALVILLHDIRGSAATLASEAARWTTMVPTTAFVAFDGVERPEAAAVDCPPASSGSSGSQLNGLDIAARDLEPLLAQQLRFFDIDASRVVLVGFGYGGALALHLVFHHGWSCAGVLAYATSLIRPLPRSPRAAHVKVRLIECIGDGHVGYSSVRDLVGLFTDHGIDARGVLLAGPVFSTASIRHGGAYLVELVATAQRGGRFPSHPEIPHAR
jgi:predicted esterase